MLGAALIHPDVRAVIPLRPEPLGQDDGTDKNACARNAAKRFVVKLRQDPPPRKCIVTADSRSANAPPIETLQHHALHYSLGVKEGDPPFLFQQIQEAEQAGRVPYSERHARAVGGIHRFRCVNEVPRKASNVDGRVHCIADGEIGASKVHHCRWVTDWRVSPRTVLHLMRGGRARWKIANETFHTLQTQGSNFEHNYGHGEQHLSVVFARRMRLAFLVDQTQQRCGALLQAVWAKLGSKRLVWERMRALFSADALTSMRQLVEALLTGFQKASPLVMRDAT
jgi:hypothetical protein